MDDRKDIERKNVRIDFSQILIQRCRQTTITIVIVLVLRPITVIVLRWLAMGRQMRVHQRKRLFQLPQMNTGSEIEGEKHLSTFIYMCMFALLLNFE